jgi:hypothetical protein
MNDRQEVQDETADDRSRSGVRDAHDTCSGGLHESAADRFVADAVTGPSTDTAARTAANAAANPDFRLAKRRGHADDGTPRRRL